MGVTILEAVKKAAKLAVYDEIMIRVKNHHIPATIRVDIALNNSKKHQNLDQLPTQIKKKGSKFKTRRKF
jgi:hypothetical protein